MICVASVYKAVVFRLCNHAADVFLQLSYTCIESDGHCHHSDMFHGKKLYLQLSKDVTIELEKLHFVVSFNVAKTNYMLFTNCKLWHWF